MENCFGSMLAEMLKGTHHVVQHLHAIHTTPHKVCRGGFRGFVGAVWAAAPTKPSLQIMHL